MDNKFPKRKHIRLSNFDYSQKGYYFITVCTDKKVELSEIERNENIPSGCGRGGYHPPENLKLYGNYSLKLTEYGVIIDKMINEISIHYPYIIIDKYVIMPDPHSFNFRCI